MDVEICASWEARKETQDLLSADLSTLDETRLGELLLNPDMRVRQKAQFELAERGDKGLEVFKAAIAQTDDRLARIHGLWGVSQLAREDDRRASLLLPLLKDEDAEIRAQAAKWLGDIRFEEASQALDPLQLDHAQRIRFFAAEALGRSEEHTS